MTTNQKVGSSNLSERAIFQKYIQIVTRSWYQSVRRKHQFCHRFDTVDHQSIFHKVFETEIPEDLDLINSADHSELEELNPENETSAPEIRDAA